ncbi:MAG: 5-formyltetrahydrofolate cyclo-ligase [Candidatus Magnetominusculus sp. LBB02]|nr:5-formyltetrahydrofolate cyclo-ligase [Candidatus Magnetominusculus sp. LBB02]
MMVTADDTTSKAALRKEAVYVRNAISSDIKKINDAAIYKNLFDTDEFINARSVMFFASIKSEPDTLTMIAAALSINKTVILPRTNLKTRALEPYIIKSLSELIPGYMGIPEPNPAACAPAGDIDIIVMPGLAFDETGGRVGYGGGYYDRFISGMTIDRPTLAAVAYNIQVIEHVPVMSYDIKVDMIITESGVINCRGKHVRG